MFSVKVTITGALFDFSPNSMLQASDRANNRINRDLMPRYQKLARAKLGSYPGPPKGTFKHKATPKQLRYVMMLIRKGLYTGRTGKLLESWVTYSTPLKPGLNMFIENSARNERGDYYATYVLGDDIQSFHEDTGWINVNDDLETLAIQLVNESADIYLDEFTAIATHLNTQFAVTPR